MEITKYYQTYDGLVEQISETYLQGQQQSVVAVNSYVVNTYWKVGQYIVEFEQNGKNRATYGAGLLERLSKDLTLRHGKGFSLSNVKRMRQLYVVYPKGAMPSHLLDTPNSKGAMISHLLSWSHYVELLKIDNELERSFYEQQTIIEKWSVAELIRQKKSSLFLRLAASKDKAGILQLAKHGQTVAKPKDLIRDPCVLEFLQIPEPYQINESELESKIITQMQHFLLELGKGFAFIGRQYRIMLGNRPHYVDLVFYHRILKCFVLIDLKREDAGYEAIEQMNMYLGYFENEENTEGDNPPIGIVLTKEKDELVVKYAMHNINSQIFVSKYQLYLPNREELIALFEKQLANEE
jgi:predicted nuclease of restriction endonuclease-like (RecB) superfamily